MIGFDDVIRVMLGDVPRDGYRFIDYSQAGARSVITSAVHQGADEEPAGGRQIPLLRLRGHYLRHGPREQVSAPVQHGPRITAIYRYLYSGQFLSKKRTTQALAELFGIPVCEVTIATMTTRAADGLDDFLTDSPRPGCG